MVTGVPAGMVSIPADNSSGDCRTQTGALVRGRDDVGVGSGVREGGGVAVFVGASVTVAEGVGVVVSGLGLGIIVGDADGAGVNVWVEVGLGVISVVVGGAVADASPKATGRRATVNCR